MQPIFLVLHVVICAGIIALVLLQHGKGADMGAGFGAGSSGTVFGSQGSLSFMFKITAFFGVVLYLNSLLLAHFAAVQSEQNQALLSTSAPVKTMTIPAAPKKVPASVNDSSSSIPVPGAPDSMKKQVVAPKNKDARIPVGSSSVEKPNHRGGK